MSGESPPFQEPAPEEILVGGEGWSGDGFLAAPSLPAPLPQEERGAKRGAFSQEGKQLNQSRAKSKSTASDWQKLQNDIAQSVAKREARARQKPAIHYPEELPVSQRADEIEALIRAHQVVIVCGETGSGKTTQLPKICLAAGRGEAGLIGHTQPRRMAARAVATRLAEELKTPLGSGLNAAVGFKVRFTDHTQPDAYIKLMTDGILLAEAQHDPWLSHYDTIIVDEAHERSLNIDFLLGYLKQLLLKRPDLKLIITSATLDADRFSRHFGTESSPAPVIEVSGRTYPVEIRCRPLGRENDVGEDADDEEGMEDAIADTVEELWRGGSGDILVFLPGEREIRETADVLRRALQQRPYASRMEILPLYARLSVSDQQRIFSKSDGRRIVLSTNVAETSLTVPGIRYVIDTGLARVKRYSLRNKTTLLRIEKISRAAANQRAGRCGRIEAGVCVRLYGEEDFQARPEYTDPEILRSSLASVILQMAALKLGQAEFFPFVDAPGSRAIADGYQLLRELDAMDVDGTLTSTGRELSRLPLDPRIGRIVLMAREKACLPEALVIASALAVPDARERPLDKQQAADQAHLHFRDERSDFLSLVALWEFFAGLNEEKLSHRKTVERCRAQFVNYLRCREWRDVHKQLVNSLKEANWQWDEALPKTCTTERYRALHEALLTGLLSNIGTKADESDEYLGARGIRFFVHPGSGVKKSGRWILAAELTETSRLYARCVARIEPEWIEAIAGDRVNKNYFDPHWDEKRGEVTGFERVQLYGLTLVARRQVSFSRVDPKAAHEVFVREALVPGKLRTKGAFLTHNQQLIDDVAELEHKARRQDVLVDDETMAAFYFERVPPEVNSLASFERWREKNERSDPQRLFLTRELLMRHAARWVTEDLFPEFFEVQSNALPLKYRFEPEHSLDGLTLTVPLTLLNQIDAARMSWLVPGMVRDKITWYFKALPKAQRNRLVPLPESVTGFLEAMPFGELFLSKALCVWYEKNYGGTLDTASWKDEDLPQHLRMSYEVIDAEGTLLSQSRDLSKLQQELKEMAQVSLSAGASEKHGQSLEKRGLVCWDFGTLPETLALTHQGQKLIAYPALVDEENSVALLLRDTQEIALQDTRAGIVRLIRLALKDLLTRWEKQPPGFQQPALQLKPLIPTDRLLTDILNAVCDRAFIGDDPLPRNEKAFNDQVKRARTRFAAVAESAFRLLGEIAAEHQQLTGRMNGASSAFSRLIQELKAQRDTLLYPGFFSETPWPQLAHLPRYLKAMDRRLAKYPERVARDQKHGAQMLVYWQRYQERWARDKKERVHHPQLEAYRWLLEELRVSLFAQELKTLMPVSFQRVEKAWAALITLRSDP
ncbi:MAG: ATP-dependent RNA helicase HrpA [Burkholderiales bacterium]|nr:ATP-dependent RNA helicase HrpA [Burkholderiales bacterium]